MALIISYTLFALSLIVFSRGTETIRRFGWQERHCKIFFALVMSSSLWCISFGFLWIQTDPKIAAILRAIGMVGTFLYLFFVVLIILEWSPLSGRITILFKLFPLCGFILYPFIVSPICVTYYVTDMGMVYQMTNNLWNTLYSLYCVIVGVIAFIGLFSMTRKGNRTLIRDIGKKTIYCLLVVFIGMLFDTILPQFGFDAFPGSTTSQVLGVLMMERILTFYMKSQITIPNLSEFIYDSMNIPILIYDSDGILQIISKGAAEFLHIRQESEHTIPLVNIFAVEKDALKFSSAKTSLDAPCLYNDSFCNLEIHKIFDTYQDVIGYIVIINDMTERINFINELKKSQQKAEIANEAKSNFLAQMSHEIRTPMNAVIGMDEMILRECQDSKIKSYATTIRSAAKTLLSIVNNILDLSKIEANAVTLEEAEYRTDDMFRTILNIFSMKAEDKGLLLHYSIAPELPQKLLGDETRIKQIITNLINNALKYTRKGSVTLDVSFHPLKENRIMLKILVIDTGIGIRDSDFDKIFDAFERVDEKKNCYVEGTGLGLSIVRSLVDLMGGTIRLTSEYGKGSTFTVEIPQTVQNDSPIGLLNLGISQEEPEASCEPLIIPDARILLVDDNEINLIVTEELLKRTHARIDAALSGRECLELVTQNKYDVILLDHMMPEMDGLQTLEQLKTMEGNMSRDAAVIVMTANAISGVREFYLESGFDDYLSKPVDFKLMEDTLRKYCHSDTSVSS